MNCELTFISEPMDRVNCFKSVSNELDQQFHTSYSCFYQNRSSFTSFERKDAFQVLTLTPLANRYTCSAKLLLICTITHNHTFSSSNPPVKHFPSRSQTSNSVTYVSITAPTTLRSSNTEPSPSPCLPIPHKRTHQLNDEQAAQTRAIPVA